MNLCGMHNWNFNFLFDRQELNHLVFSPENPIESHFFCFCFVLLKHHGLQYKKLSVS